MYQILAKKRKNSRKYEKIIYETNSIEEANIYLQTWYKSFHKPYIFTHINAQNLNTGEDVIIKQTAGQFLTSPTELFNALTA